jgi:hypothetical protein
MFEDACQAIVALNLSGIGSMQVRLLKEVFLKYHQR